VILYGRNPVREALRGRRRVERVWATDAAAGEPWLEGRAKVVAAADLEALCGSAEHQGVCAEAGDYPYADADSLLEAEDALVGATTSSNLAPINPNRCSFLGDNISGSVGDPVLVSNPYVGGLPPVEGLVVDAGPVFEIPGGGGVTATLITVCNTTDVTIDPPAATFSLVRVHPDL